MWLRAGQLNTMLTKVKNIPRTSGFRSSMPPKITRSFSGETSNRSGRKVHISVTAGGAVAIAVGIGVAARCTYDMLLDKEQTNQISRDSSKATVLLKTANTPKKVQSNNLSGKTSDGTNLQQVDAAEFEAFLAEQRSILHESFTKNDQEAARVLHDELKHALSDADNRISSFCDWYLSYPTTYKLLGVALESAAKHALSVRQEQTLAQRLSQDLQELVCRKYEALVLRPALTDPQIHRALVKSVQHAHDGYLRAIDKLESSLADFVAKQAEPYSMAPQSSDVVVDMDWSTQLQKVQHIPLVYEKTPVRTVGLVTAGAVAGKVAGGSLGGVALKAMSAKLAAPFATKAAATVLAGKAAVGATGGAILGGPLGAAAGAVVGIGVDMTVNAGVALMQRSALEQDVRQSLDATMLEWEERLQPELNRVQTVWYGHATALLGDEKEGTGRHR